jgi:queuine tRNA-ribosyltransferase
VVKAGEIIASMLLSWHNLTFFQDLTGALREAIGQEEGGMFAKTFLADYRAGADAHAEG